MAGIVPDKIRWRYGKSRLGRQFWKSMLRHEKTTLDDLILRNSDSIAPYADIQKLRAAYERFTAGTHSSSDAMAIWCAAMLACWLKVQSAGAE